MQWMELFIFTTGTTMLTILHIQVRFNVLRVLPRTGKQVKQFSKF